LRYDDWLSGRQLAIQEEVRRILLPIAKGAHSAIDPLLASHAAAVLVSIDPLDEVANIALASQLAATGRRAAARSSLERYVALIQRELGDPPSDAVLGTLKALQFSQGRHGQV
jgi:hypothetical protein